MRPGGDTVGEAPQGAHSPAVAAGAERTDTLRFRQGDVADHEGVRRLAERVYGVPRSARSIHWLYAANPSGPCRLWVAEDAGSGEIVGCRPIFPWRMRVGDRTITVGQAGDAMTHPDLRRRGVFGALVRLAWSGLRDQGMPFSFSFSVPGSLSVYRKTSLGEGTGTHEVLHFQRLVRPLSVGAVLERAPGLGRLSPVLEPLHRALERRWLGLPAGWTAFPVSRFGGEFDELWDRTAHRHRVLTVRDSAYLNWRFVDVPGGPFGVVALRFHGALAGYVAFEVDRSSHGWIADLFGAPDPEVAGLLLRAALAAMAAQGCRKASLWAAVESPVAPLARKLGFLPRDHPFPMAVHVYRPGLEADAALDARGWWAWYGDRDVERLVTRPAEAAESA